MLPIYPGQAVLVPVTITHLEMTSPTQLVPGRIEPAGAAVVRVPRPIPELNRFFYTAIGGDWDWYERLPWNYSEWQKYLDRPELETWIVTVQGVPAGYFELERQPAESFEIVYFGLLNAFAGNGMGGWALTRAVERAWHMGAKRVWVHTCDRDHPAALKNYLSRGFTIFKTETRTEDLPEKPIGPWPGSRP